MEQTKKEFRFAWIHFGLRNAKRINKYATPKNNSLGRSCLSDLFLEVVQYGHSGSYFLQ